MDVLETGPKSQGPGQMLETHGTHLAIEIKGDLHLEKVIGMRGIDQETQEVAEMQEMLMTEGAGMLEIPEIDQLFAEKILGILGSCEEMIEIDSLHGNRRQETQEKAHWTALQDKVARGIFQVTATETKAGHL